MSFSTKLIKLRDANGWTQEEFAERIGVSRSTIAKWEAGKGTPKLENLIRISKLANVSIDSLITD